MIKISLNEINQRIYGKTISRKEWRKLLSCFKKTKADDEQFPLETILGLIESESVFQCLPRLNKYYDHAEALFTANLAERVLHIFEAERPDDDRPRKAIKARQEWARDLMSDFKNTLAETSRDALKASHKAKGEAAKYAAIAAAWGSPWESAMAAAQATAHATLLPPYDAGWGVAYAKERKEQAKEFIKFCRLEGEYKETVCNPVPALPDTLSEGLQPSPCSPR